MLHVHEVVMYVQFQFHKGTIRTDITIIISQQHAHFNSIKVRLEPAVEYKSVRIILISIP